MYKQLVRARTAFGRLPDWSQTFVLAAIIGISTGLVASLLRTLMDHFEETVFFRLLGISGDFKSFPTHPWALLALPAIGGLFAGVLVAKVSPESAGGGTEGVVNAFHTRKLRWDWKVLPTKLLASSWAVGLGLAGGGEGPISQIGTLIGQRWAELFGLSKKRQREFFTAGMAAGIGAIFHAPLGGALFASEIYYRRPDVESSSLLPSLMASSLAFTVFNLNHGWTPLLPIPAGAALSPRAVGMLVLLSLACGIMSRVTLQMIQSVHGSFKKIPLAYRPGAAGLVSGGLVLAALLLTQVLQGGDGQPSLVIASLGEGYALLRLAAGGVFPLWSVLFLMLTLRLATTALAAGSDSPVGAFAPAMVIGASTGLATGLLGTWAGIPGSAVPMALAGMAAYFSASFRSPLGSVFMIAEVSQGYSMLPALMLAAALGYLAGPDPGWVPMQRKARGSRT